MRRYSYGTWKMNKITMYNRHLPLSWPCSTHMSYQYDPIHVNFTEQIVSGSTALNLYSDGRQYDSLQERLLSWTRLLVALLTPSRQMAECYREVDKDHFLPRREDWWGLEVCVLHVILAGTGYMWLVRFTARPLWPPRKERLIPVEWEFVWSTGPMWTLWRR